VLKNGHWEGLNKSPRVYHHEHWQSLSEQVAHTGVVQILHSKIVTNCEILVLAFVSRILGCGIDTDYLVQTPWIWDAWKSNQMWNYTISAPPWQKVTDLNLMNNQIQECESISNLKSTVRLSQSPQFQNSEDDSKVLDDNNAHDPYLQHYPYVPSIWNCYAHLLLHPVSRIMTMCKQYEHYLCPISMHSRLEGEWDSYCATHCCFKATIELENCKLIKKAFDPCWVANRWTSTAEQRQQVHYCQQCCRFERKQLQIAVMTSDNLQLETAEKQNVIVF
jgi:hypothetical protein